MVRILLSLLACFWLVCLNGQTIGFFPEALTVVSTVDEFPAAAFDVQNLTDQGVSFGWTIERTDVPDEWGFTICDDNLCYAEGLESLFGLANRENIFDPNELVTETFSVKLNPHGVEYCGKIKFVAHNYNDSTDVFGSIELGYNLCASSVLETEFEELSIYPNPASEYFQLKKANDVSKMSLHSIIGQEIRKFDRNDDNRYFIGDLDRGIYLVRMLDKDGRSMKVLRLNKD